MEKSHFIKLTMVLYRVTELFPRQEPLRFLIREKANEILGGLILAKKEKNKGLGQILSNIEVLQAYFDMAGEQNWVKKENFLVLIGEYNKIREEILRLPAHQNDREGERDEKGERPAYIATQSVADGGEERTLDLRKRQRRILQVLGEKQQAQIHDFKEIFPEITKRTLRRDFDELLKKGLVVRIGAQNQTIYKLK